MYEWEKKISEILIQAQREARREGIDELLSYAQTSWVEIQGHQYVDLYSLNSKAERLKEPE